MKASALCTRRAAWRPRGIKEAAIFFFLFFCFVFGCFQSGRPSLEILLGGLSRGEKMVRQTLFDEKSCCETGKRTNTLLRAGKRMKHNFDVTYFVISYFIFHILSFIIIHHHHHILRNIPQFPHGPFFLIVYFLSSSHCST